MPGRSPRARLSLLALLSLLVLGTGHSQAEDLYQSYQWALQHDMAYAAAQQRRLAAAEPERQARAALLPHLSLEAGGGWVEHRHSDTIRRNRNDSNAYALVLVQPLLRWQNLIALDQGKTRDSAAQIDLLLARQTLMLQVANAYFALLLAEDQLLTSRQQVRTLSQHLDKSRRLLLAGSGTEHVRQQVQARHDAAYAEQIAAANDLRLRQQALSRLTGRTPGELARLDTRTAFSAPQPPRLETWAEQARQYNLRVQAAELRRLIAEQETEKQQAGHLPSLDLVAAHGRFSSVGGSLYDVSLPADHYTQSVLGVRLSVPLYAGGGTLSRSREAQALLGVAEHELEDARREADFVARQAFLTLTSGISQYQALQQALNSSQSNLHNMTQAFEAGARIGSDVLDAEQQLTQARHALARQRQALLLARLELMAATGSLDEAGLQTINALLERP